jgi:hypothetical protein
MPPIKYSAKPIRVLFNGMEYDLDLGYEKPEPDVNIPGGVYLEAAYNVSMACDVPEGALWDELERLVWKMAKEDRL